MANREYLENVCDAITTMASALQDVSTRLDIVRQRGECFRPEWVRIGQEAQSLSKRCLKLAEAIQQVEYLQN